MINCKVLSKQENRGQWGVQYMVKHFTRSSVYGTNVICVPTAVYSAWMRGSDLIFKHVAAHVWIEKRGTPQSCMGSPNLIWLEVYLISLSGSSRERIYVFRLGSTCFKLASKFKPYRTSWLSYSLPLQYYICWPLLNNQDFRCRMGILE